MAKAGTKKMRLIPIEDAKPGMKLARTIFRDQDGKILLRQKAVLKPSYIQKIKDLKYRFIYIMDPDDEGKDETALEPVEEETIFQARRLVKKYFSTFKQNKNIDFSEIKKVISVIVDQIIRKPNVVYNMLDIRSHDNYTYAHSVNVCIISVMIGVVLGLNRKQLETLGIGALMHDIGKILIDGRILNKPEKLEPQEEELIRRHARDGYELLKKKANISFLSAHVAFQHHEREDGSGYPRGLNGKRIHRFAKIVAVADAYDAMTSIRAYQKGLSSSQALEEIRAGAAHKFDPAVVEALWQVVAAFPIGSIIVFTNGDKAIVKNVTKDECVVEVIEGANCGKNFNLYRQLNLKVDRVF